MSSGSTAQDPSWKDRESALETAYIKEKEQAQLAALREKQATNQSSHTETTPSMGSTADHGYEGGFGGQSDLIDKYATTSGEH